MAAKLAPLTLGSAVCFEDRWKGKVTALDITEDWEVLNLTVSSGTFFSQQSVKLPMTAVKSLEGKAVHIAATSSKAFAREVPPIAAPARPVSSDTPLSSGGLKFAGVLLNANGPHQATELLVSRGFTTYRVPVSQVGFQAATLHFTSAPEELAEYHFDDDILERTRHAITQDRNLMPDDKRYVRVSVDGGSVTLTGNVQVRVSREYLAALVSDVLGVVSVDNRVVDDIELEGAIGAAVLREGLAHARVYARAKLGEVTLYGAVASPRQAEDVERAIARVAGVRIIKNQLTVNQAVVGQGIRA